MRPKLSFFYLHHLIFSILSHLFALLMADEEICGELEVHKQQWPRAADMAQLGESRSSADLRECLLRCCALPDCSTVGFSGFLGSSEQTKANCSLFRCGGNDDECIFEDRPNAAQIGLLSVGIGRLPSSGSSLGNETTSISLITTQNENIRSISSNESHTTDHEGEMATGEKDTHIWPSRNRFPTTKADQGGSGNDGQILPPSPEQDLGEEELAKLRANASSSRSHHRSLLDLGSWDERFPLNANSTPVWAIGLAICVTVVSLGLLIAMLSSFLCYRRYRTRMRSTDISGPKKMPTLHAFNPS